MCNIIIKQSFTCTCRRVHVCPYTHVHVHVCIQCMYIMDMFLQIGMYCIYRTCMYRVSCTIHMYRVTCMGWYVV